MAFNNKNLAMIAYANGFSWWNYHTTDPIETVLTDDYFAPIKHLMNNGDVIYINIGTDLYIRCMYCENGTVKLKETK